MRHRRGSGTQQTPPPVSLVAVKKHTLNAAKLKCRHPRRWGAEHPSGGRAVLPPRKMRQAGKELEATPNTSCSPSPSAKWLKEGEYRVGVSRIYYLHVWQQHAGQMSPFLVSAIQRGYWKIGGDSSKNYQDDKKNEEISRRGVCLSYQKQG